MNVCNYTAMTPNTESTHPCMVVIFGRPGAGKSTLSEEAVRLLTNGSVETKTTACLYLDLDVCVPQWMRDNFAKGIYPTLQQRHTFITEACNYIQSEITSKSSCKDLVVLISFSFVNTDMRIIFREQYRQSQWVLVDTKPDVAEERILARQGHFYKGANAEAAGASTGDDCANGNDPKDGSNKSDSRDNSEWEFQPVEFPHVVLDGCDSITENAKHIVKVIQKVKEYTVS